jgi:NTE family protein
LDRSAKDEKPDEIWVVRINPQEIDRQRELTSLEDIRDRENDLAGNLSLNQELDHILTMNHWLAESGGAHPVFGSRKTVVVRTIKMRRETAWGLRLASKFHRSQEHMKRLHDEGREVAEQWLSQWRVQEKDFASYPDDARYPEQG